MDIKIVVEDGSVTKKITAKEGELLLDILRDANTSIQAPCGGAGKCRKCAAEIKGHGEVLTCQTRLSPDLIDPDSGEVYITLPVHGGAVIKSLGEMPAYALNPLIWDMSTKISAPGLKDQMPDDSRIEENTGMMLGHHLLNKLPGVLRKADYDIKLSVRQDINEITDIWSAQDERKMYGIAVDIGTTTLSLSLFDIDSGNFISSASGLNPQKAYGADVISRIDYASTSEKNLFRLKELIVDEIIKLSRDMTADLKDLFILSIAGNTTMMHLLCGYDPAAIAKAPFIPVTLRSQIKYFHEIFPEMVSKMEADPVCLLLPSLAGYVGADITAGIIATELDRADKPSLLVDIGTNGEIALKHNGKIVCCSVAAGPAFEGANITCGTGGISGAVDKTSFDNGEIKFTTINNEKPSGICGSGIVSAVSTMLRSGVIDETGRFCEEGEICSYIDTLDNDDVFVLHKDPSGTPKVYMTQKDVREVQNAKAAVCAGIKLLISKAGLKPEQVEKVFIAGGFGNFMNVDEALDIGLLPIELKGKIVSAGNTSAAGAALCMLDHSAIERLKDIEEMTEYYELSSDAQFTELYVDSMIFEQFE